MLGVVRLQDEIELDHLQRHRDAPVDVSAHDRRRMDLFQEYAHVEVVHRGQGNPDIVLSADPLSGRACEAKPYDSSGL